MGLRWEIASLAVAFKKDVNDDDRPFIPESHLAFYYQKYHKRILSPKLFGKDNVTELLTMIKDTANITDDALVVATAEDASFDLYLRLAEELRRARQRRIDAGD